MEHFLGSFNIPDVIYHKPAEVSEALEAQRNHDEANFGEELTDTIIRVFDTGTGLGINIQDEVVKKHMKNIERPFRHGGKKC